MVIARVVWHRRDIRRDASTIMSLSRIVFGGFRVGGWFGLLGNWPSRVESLGIMCPARHRTDEHFACTSKRTRVLYSRRASHRSVHAVRSFSSVNSVLQSVAFGIYYYVVHSAAPLRSWLYLREHMCGLMFEVLGLSDTANPTRVDEQQQQ